MSYLDKIMEYLDKDALVSKLGLEQKSSSGEKILSALGLVGLGAVMGAGIALLLAPKSGRDLRDDIRNKLVGSDDYTPAPMNSSELSPRMQETEAPRS